MTEVLFGAIVGIGLAAACGFRIFVPFFAASLAVHAGYLQPMPGFEWLGSPLAISILGVATIVEILAYFIPWVDNLLDSMASPAAIVAGTVMTATFLPESNSVLGWAIAAILGGGTAGVIQGGTVLVRGASTASSGGLANPVVSTAELGGAVAMASMAIFVPMLALVVLALLFAVALRFCYRKAFRRTRRVTFIEPSPERGEV